jgi:hypothetical protein
MKTTQIVSNIYDLVTAGEYDNEDMEVKKSVMPDMSLTDTVEHPVVYICPMTKVVELRDRNHLMKEHKVQIVVTKKLDLDQEIYDEFAGLELIIDQIMDQVAFKSFDGVSFSGIELSELFDPETLYNYHQFQSVIILTYIER